MAVTSRLPAAKDALKALLVARAGLGGNPLAGVPIDMGWPVDLQHEHVWIQQTARTRFEMPVTGGGPQLREEHGVITVEVWITTPGNDYTTSRNRAFELAGEVLIVCRADADLGDQVSWVGVSEIREEPAIAEDARGLFLEIDVEFDAQLTA